MDFGTIDRMQFHVDPLIFRNYPELHIGVLVCKGVQNTSAPDGIAKMLRIEESTLRTGCADPELLKEHPIIAAWQEVHRSFGSNPNKFPSSVHALAKRVVKGAELPSISPLVDLYNVISLRHMIPAGGEDLEKINGDIHLTVADGSESFNALGETENSPPEPGEVIYRDDAGVICRKFNWREAARTALQPETTDAILVLEAIPPFQKQDLETALAELKELVERFCAGSQSIHVLDKSHSSIGV